jgi:hypothetical protein
MGNFSYFYGSKKGESIKSYEEWEKVFHMHDSKGRWTTGNPVIVLKALRKISCVTMESKC